MTLQLTKVTQSLAALDVPGVTILDLYHVPATAGLRLPCLFPEPTDFLTGFEAVRNSFGGGSSALMTVSYTLRYTFAFAPVGSGRTGVDLAGEFIEALSAILDAILAIDELEGAIDILPLSITEMGAFTDPAGNGFIGCRVSVRVTEFVND